MAKAKKKIILIVALSVFIIHFTAMNCHAITSNVAAGVLIPPSGGSGSDGNVGGFTAGGGSVTPIGAVTPGLFTGTMIYRIPIEVPSGRHGMEPSLALSYSSSNGNGWVGVGWDLEVGAIERGARFGVNYNDNAASQYILRKAGSAIELIADASGLYHAQIEGNFDRIQKLTATDGKIYWQITDKSGVSYLYGQTAVSRQDDPSGTQIFKWCLNQVIDANGNYVTLSYFKDQGEIYLDQIDYTGNLNGAGTTNYVKFYRESRTDAPDMYTINFKVTTAYRLKAIDVFANDSRVRAYQLNYLPYSSSTGRSVLSSVQQFGSDAAVDPSSGLIPGGSALPAITFGTQMGADSWSNQQNTGLKAGFPVYNLCFTGDLNGDGNMDFWCETASNSGLWNVALSAGSTWTTEQWNGPKVASPVSDLCFTGDLDGDGKTDFWCETAASSGLWNVSFSTGSGWATSQWWGPITGSPVSNQCFIGDLNGDGKADFWCETAASSGLWMVAVLNGSGWGMSQWSGPKAGWPVSNLCFTGDLNGDGKTDLWCETAASSGLWNVALSIGYAWTTSQWSGPQVGSPVGKSCFTGDINGDGKTDFWCETAASSGLWNVAFSTGSSWATNQWSGPSTGLPVSNLCIMSDLNGDGKTDFWCETAASSGLWNVAFSTGSDWTTSQWSGPITGSPVSDHCFMGDLNGDSKTDFWCETAASSGTWNTAIVDGSGLPDLLTSIQNGIGGSKTIAYSSSTQYQNTQLPFPVQTVSSVTSDDGNGVISSTTYTYSGGYYHTGERDFRGFNYVKVTGQAGPNGEQEVSETWFHQGNDIAVDSNDPSGSIGYMKGNPYRTRVSDAKSGAIYTETTTAYAADADGYAPYFNPPLQVDIYNCDGKISGACAGNPSAQHIQTVYTYDNTNGNDLREDRYGDLADPTDDLTIVTSYALNKTAWILNKPASETIYQGTYPGVDTANLDPTKKVSTTTYYYDGTTDCNTASSNQVPAPGNLTRIVRWLDGTHDPDVRMAYDTYGYGSVSCMRDSNGNSPSIITYDGSFTFPLVVTNPLGQQEKTSYYGVDGVQTDTGLYGQVKSSTDSNNATTTMQYDALGRKTKVILPDGTSTTWGYNIIGAVGSQNVQTTNAAGLSTWFYFDGLGRTIAEKSAGPDGNIIAFQTKYNSTGTVSQTSLPYFDGVETSQWVSYTYDAMGRALTMTAPDTPDYSSASMCYYNGVTVYIDPDQHRKRITKNAQGKLVKVEEYTGPFSSCTTDALTSYATTTYQYDVLGSLRFVTDAEGNQAEMRYDHLGRKVFMHDPDMSGPNGNDWTYFYDANGNLVSQTDAKVQTITFNYDPLNRPVRKHYPTGSDVVYTYDVAPDSTMPTYPIGRLSTMADASGTTNYYYDQLGRSTGTSKIIGSTRYDFKMSYDALGRIASLTYPYPDTETVSYAYNAGALAAVINSAGSPYAIYDNYNAVGQPGTITYGNGVTTAYQYYPTNKRLQSIVTGNVNQTIMSLAYDYNPGGSIRDIVDNVNGANTQSFWYDELNRIQEAQSQSYGALWYNYSPAGNITMKEGVTYDYTGPKPHAVKSTSDGGAYTYDANGNMTSDGIRTISYDYDNMPQSVTVSNATTSFVYDGAGTRVKKTTSLGDDIYFGKLYECMAGNCTKYIFAGDTRVAMKTGAAVLYYHGDHLGSTQAVSQVGAVQDGQCSNQPVRIAGATPQYFSTIQAAYDAASDGDVIQTMAGNFIENLNLSSGVSVTLSGGYDCTYTSQAGRSELVGMVSDNAGSLTIQNFELLVSGYPDNSVAQVHYLPFGATYFDAGGITVNHKYTAQEFDAETGLYNYNARFYNPALGRFISADSIVNDPSNPQSLNRYSYVLNNPMIYTDPTGHMHWGDFFSNLFSTWVGELLIQSVEPIYGSYELTKSKTGSYILGGEIIVGTAVATWYCGGCGDVAGAEAADLVESAYAGALTGEIAGGVSAYRSGGNFLHGVVVGGVAGGVTGYLGGATYNAIGASDVANIAQGAITGFGTGVATGYAGGNGNVDTMLSSGLHAAIFGGILGGLTPYGKGLWNEIYPGTSSFTLDEWRLLSPGTGLVDFIADTSSIMPDEWSLLWSVGSGVLSGLSSSPIKNTQNATGGLANSNLTYSNSKNETLPVVNSLTVNEMGD